MILGSRNVSFRNRLQDVKMALKIACQGSVSIYIFDSGRVRSYGAMALPLSMESKKSNFAFHVPGYLRYALVISMGGFLNGCAAFVV